MDSQISNLPKIDTAANEINALHDKAEGLAKTSKDYASQAIQIALEIGFKLEQQRAKCEKGKWVEWQDKNLSFTRQHAHRYLTLYRKVVALGDASQDEAQPLETECNTPCYTDETSSDTVCPVESDQYDTVCRIQTKDLLNDAKSLRQALEAVGIFPKPAPKSAEDKIKPTITFVKNIDAFILWFEKRTRNDPISKWKPETRALLITNLRPIMDIYKQLVALQDDAGYHVRESQRP